MTAGADRLAQEAASSHGRVVTVSEAPPDMPPPRVTSASSRDDRLGLNLGELPSSRRDKLGLDGVPVLEAHGAASRSGVQSDDVIVAVGDSPVRSIADFDAALAAAARERPIALLVVRNGVLAYLVIERTR